MDNAKCHKQLHLMQTELLCHILRVTVSWNGPDVSKIFKFSLVMALQEIMMDFQQNGGFCQPSGICLEFNKVVYVWRGLDLEPSTFRSEFQHANHYINAPQQLITKGKQFKHGRLRRLTIKLEFSRTSSHLPVKWTDASVSFQHNPSKICPVSGIFAFASQYKHTEEQPVLWLKYTVSLCLSPWENIINTVKAINCLSVEI